MKRTRKNTRNRPLYIAITIALAFSLAMAIKPVVVKAISSGTNTQITVKYYKGVPTDYHDSYSDALSKGDHAVNYNEFETRSCGRLQWGDKKADGSYAVYYDAKDIHDLAVYLNKTSEEYQELYKKYQEAAKVVYE